MLIKVTIYQKHTKNVSTLLSNWEYNQESFYMNTQPDFEELLKLLEQNKVIYMIVGGYAVAFHGYPRFTAENLEN